MKTKGLNLKTYNIQLTFNSTEDQQAIVDFLYMYQKTCNKASQIIFPKKDNLSLKHIHDLCYNELRKEFPDMPSQAVIKAYKEISASYKSIKSNKHKIETPLEKKGDSMRLDKRLYSKFTKTSIDITSPTTKNKRIKATFKLYKKAKDLFKKYSTCDPLIFIRDDKIFISIPFEIPLVNPKDDSVLGIDLGLRRLITTSDGNVLSSKEYLKHKRRIRYNKRKAQSKKTKSAKRKIRSYKKRERNFSKDYIHKVANKILETDKSIIVMEDLSKIKQKTSKTKEGYKRKKHNNRISQVPFYMLLKILTYKALHLGKSVVTVNPYKTSKEDCRGLKDGVRKGCRYYAVDNYVFDADWNAAINIAKKHSKHPISFNLPIDGKLNPLGRLICQPADSRDFS